MSAFIVAQRKAFDNSCRKEIRIAVIGTKLFLKNTEIVLHFVKITDIIKLQTGIAQDKLLLGLIIMHPGVLPWSM